MSEGFLRPEAKVLGEESLIPERNVVRPPPNQFTHEIVAGTPFYFGTHADAGEPNGRFEAGARVVLLVRGDDRCRVVDGRGIYAEVGSEMLVELPRK